MITVTKIFTFDAAHQLPDYEGSCRNLHGHTYKLEVTVGGPVDLKTGMVVDFAVLGEVVRTSVINVLDHTLLNDRVANPTAENLVAFIYKELNEWAALQGKLVRLRLWETPTSYCEWIK